MHRQGIRYCAETHHCYCGELMTFTTWEEANDVWQTGTIFMKRRHRMGAYECTVSHKSTCGRSRRHLEIGPYFSILKSLIVQGLLKARLMSWCNFRCVLFLNDKSRLIIVTRQMFIDHAIYLWWQFEAFFYILCDRTRITKSAICNTKVGGFLVWVRDVDYVNWATELSSVRSRLNYVWLFEQIW